MVKLLQEYQYHLSFRKRFHPDRYDRSISKPATLGADGAWNEALDTAYQVLGIIIKELDRTGTYPQTPQ